MLGRLYNSGVIFLGGDGGIGPCLILTATRGVSERAKESPEISGNL